MLHACIRFVCTGPACGSSGTLVTRHSLAEEGDTHAHTRKQASRLWKRGPVLLLSACSMLRCRCRRTSSSLTRMSASSWTASGARAHAQQHVAVPHMPPVTVSNHVGLHSCTQQHAPHVLRPAMMPRGVCRMDEMGSAYACIYRNIHTCARCAASMHAGATRSTLCAATSCARRGPSSRRCCAPSTLATPPWSRTHTVRAVCGTRTAPAPACHTRLTRSERAALHPRPCNENNVDVLSEQHQGGPEPPMYFMLYSMLWRCEWPGIEAWVACTCVCVCVALLASSGSRGPPSVDAFMAASGFIKTQYAWRPHGEAHAASSKPPAGKL